MDVLYPRCAGLDVHKDTVVACARVASDGAAKSEVRSFDTTTAGLLALSAWLAASGCTHVAMEATGVYWKPVWHILSDGEVTLILANAAHVKNVPGRKTDVADAVWLADLLAHGLIRASFVPEAPIQEMRALLRTRKQLVREQASHVQRIQKTLEDANLKLASVLTQIMGVSGRAILQALIDGEDDPDKLLTLVQRGVKAPPERLRAALQGRVAERHRFLLRLHLRHIDALDTAIAEIDAEVNRDLDPFQQAVRQLQTIPGVSDLTAQVIVSEIGRVCGQGKFSYGQDYFPDRSCAPADCADCRMRRGFGRAAAVGSGAGLAGSPRSLGWTGCASRQIVWCNNAGSDVDRRQRLCVRSLSEHDRHSRRRRQGRPPERQSYAPGWRPSESVWSVSTVR